MALAQQLFRVKPVDVILVEVPEPEGPYGAVVGQSFPRMQLTDCDSEEPYVLYDEAEYCPAQVTFISVAAGW